MKIRSVLSLIIVFSALLLLSSCLPHVHEFGEWTVTTEAECERVGERVRLCSCGDKETESLSATGHNYSGGICQGCGADEPSPDEYFIFTELDNGTYSVKARDQYTISGKIVIPSEYNGKPVTEIVTSAFSWCDKITEVVIPDSITTIGTVAFHGCSSMTKVNIPTGLSEIPQHCFAACRLLEEVVMHDGITKIGYGAFINCDHMTEIDIPDSVEVIGDCAFQGCSNLEKIDIPEGVELIGMNCFNNCVSLTEVRIPDSVIHIGNEAFYSCLMLETVYLPTGIILIHPKAFYLCKNISDVYYAGGEVEWNDMTIDNGNECLTSANRHYNHTGE